MISYWIHNDKVNNNDIEWYKRDKETKNNIKITIYLYGFCGYFHPNDSLHKDSTESPKESNHL